MAYSETLFLPKTDFPMRANAAIKEPELLAKWEQDGLYTQMRREGEGRPLFVLHDGPPYANGNIHIGHALNKVLKDITCRSRRMDGYDVDFRPGWDCHGLPIEWQVERELIEDGVSKEAISILAFRKRCRDYARRWVAIQREQFKALAIAADWDNPYLTMDAKSETAIAIELMHIVLRGIVYRGLRPVPWSYAEHTALAEAEIEYHDVVSPSIYVAFELQGGDLTAARAIIWTTTPWTIPANRAICYSSKIAYGLYEVTLSEPGDIWRPIGSRYVVADARADEVFRTLPIEVSRIRDVTADELGGVLAHHPFRSSYAYDYDIPFLDGEHVSADSGTGLVHTAPSHGREDYDVWIKNEDRLRQIGVETELVETVSARGRLQVAGFEGLAVFDDSGSPADRAVIEALSSRGAMVKADQIKHPYPHSWRSKKPLITRLTPQWFIAMDRSMSSGLDGRTLRATALDEIQLVTWEPQSSINRIKGMVASRPDWLISRQRSWGVPIPLFVDDDGRILDDANVNLRIADAFEEEGTDAWFADGARQRFLGELAGEDWDKVEDVLDVWFDSGTSYAYVTEPIRDHQTKVIYMEGTDQHRGWFQSSLLASCAAVGTAPFDTVVTHGFALDHYGDKMAKTKGNTVRPEAIVENFSVDILRLWIAASDYTDDLNVNRDTIRGFAEMYKKMRNTLRWMLGVLTHHDTDVVWDQRPRLEVIMHHELLFLNGEVQDLYAKFNYKRAIARLNAFLATDLSAFYFDVRKDALYCEAKSSLKRHGVLSMISDMFDVIVPLIAPIMPFLAEEAWQSRYPDRRSIHLEQFEPAMEFADMTPDWWGGAKKLRSDVLGELEKARVAKLIGAPEEAAVIIRMPDDPVLLAGLVEIEFAELCLVSKVDFMPNAEERIVVQKSQNRKCERSRRYTADVGSDPKYPDVSARDAAALREWELGR